MGESLQYSVEQKNLDTKECALYDSIYVIFLKRDNDVMVT